MVKVYKSKVVILRGKEKVAISNSCAVGDWCIKAGTTICVHFPVNQGIAHSVVGKEHRKN